MNERGSNSVVRMVFFSACVAMAFNGAWAQTAAPSSDDNPVYAAFKQLEKAPAYHMRLTMQSNDPRMAQAAAMGFGFAPIDKVVKGGTSQVIMRMKMPAVDVPGTVDDWEIRVVAQNGRAARMFSSPAIPRLIKLQEQQFAMQTAMLEKQAAMGAVQALAAGPVGGIRAAMTIGETVAFTAMARHELTKAEHFWDWKCLDQSGGTDTKSAAQLTEIKPLGDDNVNGKAASAFEFYVNQNEQRQGPVRLLVAKDSGLPARIHMDDPGGRGSVDMDYDLETSGDIEVPSCLAGH
jgi:hypothetical protein